MQVMSRVFRKSQKIQNILDFSFLLISSHWNGRTIWVGDILIYRKWHFRWNNLLKLDGWEVSLRIYLEYTRLDLISRWTIFIVGVMETPMNFVIWQHLLGIGILVLKGSFIGTIQLLRSTLLGLRSVNMVEDKIKDYQPLQKKK